MDLRAPRHYVASAMSFLLVLSALLSAVTGAFAGARAPETASHRHAQVAPAAATVVKAAVLVARPSAAVPYMATRDVVSVAQAPPTAEPVGTDRLIE